MVNLTEERKDKILRAITDGVGYGYDLRSIKHRYFFVEKFHETDFKKITPRAPMGSRVFDLTQILETDQPPSTQDIAELLNNKTCGVKKQTQEREKRLWLSIWLLKMRLKALAIEDFRNISKDKIMEFVSAIPNMDKEVAIKIIEQFPLIRNQQYDCTVKYAVQ